MNSIYTYTDYRKYLHDFYLEKKSEDKSFSYRYIAEVVGFKSAGHFTQIIKGSANISQDLARKFTRLCRLRTREIEFFLLMVQFNQARNHLEKKTCFEKMAGFRQSLVKIVEADQYAFYDKWYFSVVLQILDFYPFKGETDQEFKELGRMLVPSISTADARRAITLLDSLHLIQKDDLGLWRKVDAVISTGYEARSVAINNFYLNTLQLAAEAIDRFEKDERNLSWLTLSLSDQSYAAIQEELRKFRRTALEIARNDQAATTVFQFNFQVFPLSRPHRTGDAE